MGTPCAQVLAYLPEYHLGIPVRWVGDSALDRGIKAERFDPEDPPTFESQAAFLKRHGLLARGEALQLPTHALDPETLPRDLWPEPTQV